MSVLWINTLPEVNRPIICILLIYTRQYLIQLLVRWGVRSMGRHSGTCPSVACCSNKKMPLVCGKLSEHSCHVNPQEQNCLIYVPCIRCDCQRKVMSRGWCCTTGTRIWSNAFTLHGINGSPSKIRDASDIMVSTLTWNATSLSWLLGCGVIT